MTIGIVGMGIAGLRTAMLLEQAGYTVKLFEARDRLGGCFEARRQAVQLALHAKARVFAIASGEGCDRLRQLGCELVLDYKTQNIKEEVMKATGGKANPAAVNDILKKKLGL